MDLIIRTCKTWVLALALFAPAGAGASDSKSNVDLYWQAVRLELSERPVEALKGYRKLLATAPDSSVAARQTLSLAVQEGDYATALQALRTLQLKETAESHSPLLFFVDAWRRKNWTDADNAIDDLKQRKDFAFVAPILAAWVERAQGKPSSIDPALLREQPLLGFYADDQLVYLALASGDIELAKKRLNAFSGFGSDYGRQLAYEAAPVLAAKGDLPFAQQMLTHVGGASNWQPAPKSGKGLSPETAIAALFGRLSAQLRSQDAENDALYFARLGQWIAPEDAAARITLARALDDVGASAKAQPLLASIPADSLHWRAAVLQQARMLSAAGDPANALRLTNDAVAKAPDSIELRLQLAQLHEEQSDFAAAEASYRTLNETIKASPRQKAVFKMLLAQLFDRQDKWAEAKVELEAAMVLDPQNPQLLNFLGYSLLERRQEIKRGFELVSRAHTLVPDSPEIADSLGWGYFLANDVENAIPLLESAVQGSLNDVTINEHLGDAYWHAGRKIDARYAWRAAALQAEDKVVERLESKLAIGLTASNAAP